LAEADEPKALKSAITEVTVYADRARVTRTASVQLTADTARYAFHKLPAWIDEGSVRVNIWAPEGDGELLDVQVLKTFLARPDDEEVSKAQREVQDLADQIAALDDERAVLEAQARQLDAIRVFSLEKLPKDAATREVKIEEYEGVVKFIGRALTENARAKRELARKRRDLQPELDARQRRLSELRQRGRLEQRTVVVTARGNAGPREAILSLVYMLPGATWEPLHELRTTDGTAISLASFAVVTQTTGEDWAGANLALSSQRSTQTIRIPELDALLLGDGRALNRVLSPKADTFQIATDNFTGQWGLWNDFANSDADQVEFAENRKALQARQARVVQVFEALQRQRGTTAHFQAAGKQTVRTDGRAVRLPIGTLQLEAKSRTLAAPEVSLNAARIADMVNAGRQPLLPGKVLLFVEGSFLGTTDIDFIAQGEDFTVFLGVADQIKLSRTLDKKRSALSWSGKRKRMQVSFLVTVENLSEEAATVQLGDRVPVSQTADIRVLDVELTPAAKPDVKGLIKWEVALAPKQTREFRIEYLLEYRADLLRQRKAAPAASPEAINDEAADSSLRREIHSLEAMF